MCSNQEKKSSTEVAYLLFKKFKCVVNSSVSVSVSGSVVFYSNLLLLFTQQMVNNSRINIQWNNFNAFPLNINSVHRHSIVTVVCVSYPG